MFHEFCLTKRLSQIALELSLCVKSITIFLHFRFVVLAGDVSPIDVISHFPVLCEDNNLPYCYVPSRLVGTNFC